jgi:beta-glucosidase
MNLFLLTLLSLSQLLNAQENDLLEILNQMTPEEKCGQMTQVTFDVIEKDGFVLNDDPVDLNRLKIAIVDKHVGSILNTPKDIAQKGAIWQKIIKHIHDVTLNTRLQIPVLYGIDSIHGANYIQEAVLFPQPLAQAASFNTEMAEKIGEIVAKETRAAGIPWNFSPSMDIGRQPAWPRIWGELFLKKIFLNVN